jgi:hypothetical protein
MIVSSQPDTPSISFRLLSIWLWHCDDDYATGILYLPLFPSHLTLVCFRSYWMSLIKLFQLSQVAHSECGLGCFLFLNGLSLPGGFGREPIMYSIHIYKYFSPFSYTWI